MKRLLFLLLVITLISCKKEEDFEKKLTQSKWVYYPDEKFDKDSWPPFYLKFYEGGSCKGFHLSGAEYNVKQSSKRWEYSPEGKKLVVNGHEFKVLSVEGDTIHMLSKQYNLKVMLYNVDKTLARIKRGPGGIFRAPDRLQYKIIE